jgi:2-isopropylmalate synthase
MDATRTPIDYLCRCVEAAIRSGATTINLPDTVGYATPEEYRAMFRAVRERVPNADKAVFSAHCHNDLGLAVANSLAALEGGARQIECTLNGIGERAGNAALEEIVMAIRTRGDVLPYETGVEATMLMRASKLASAATSFPVQYNKAIVGRNAFAHESGIHQDGMLKNAQTYEIMTPESVGVSKTSLVMGKHSGRAAFRNKLEELGYTLSTTSSRTPSSASRTWPTARSTCTTRTSRPWWTRTSPRLTTASSWCLSPSWPAPAGRSAPP